MAHDRASAPLFRVGETMTRRQFLSRLRAPNVSGRLETFSGGSRTVIRTDLATRSASLSSDVLGDLVVIGDRAWIRPRGGTWQPPDESVPELVALSDLAASFAASFDAEPAPAPAPERDRDDDAELDSRTLTVVGTEQRHGRTAFVLTGTVDADHGRMVFTHVVSDDGIQFEVGSETDDDPALSLLSRHVEWDVPQHIVPPTLD